MVETTTASEVGEKYYKCENCDNEGFAGNFTDKTCSCGSPMYEDPHARVYKCESCGGVTADRDYAKGCCD